MTFREGNQIPPSGAKVWFKTGNFEQDPLEDVEFWKAKDAYFTYRRNLAVSEELESWNKLQKLLQIGAYISGGAFLLSAIFAGLKAVT